MEKTQHMSSKSLRVPRQVAREDQQLGIVWVLEKVAWHALMMWIHDDRLIIHVDLRMIMARSMMSNSHSNMAGELQVRTQTSSWYWTLTTSIPSTASMARMEHQSWMMAYLNQKVRLGFIWHWESQLVCQHSQKQHWIPCRSQVVNNVQDWSSKKYWPMARLC